MKTKFNHLSEGIFNGLRLSQLQSTLWEEATRSLSEWMCGTSVTQGMTWLSWLSPWTGDISWHSKSLGVTTACTTGVNVCSLPRYGSVADGTRQQTPERVCKRCLDLLKIRVKSTNIYLKFLKPSINLLNTRLWHLQKRVKINWTGSFLVFQLRMNTSACLLHPIAASGDCGDFNCCLGAVPCFGIW